MTEYTILPVRPGLRRLDAPAWEQERTKNDGRTLSDGSRVAPPREHVQAWPAVAGCHSDQAPDARLPRWCVTSACGAYPHLEERHRRAYGCETCRYRHHIQKEGEQ